MATITQKQWKRYTERLREIDDKAAEEFRSLIIGKGGYGNIDRDMLIDYAYALSTKYGEASATLSAQMYDAIAELSGAAVPAALPAATASYSEVAKTVNGIIKNTGSDQVLAQGVGKLVKQAGADTMLQNAYRDRPKGKGSKKRHSGAQVAWVPVSDTCPFCMTLASKGWQNQTEWAANDHAEHIHANCDCTYAVRFDGKSGIEGYDPDVYREMYENAEGNSSSEKINSMRRMQYQENKDRINAQKRAAYAEKKELNTKTKTAKKYYMNHGAIVEGDSQVLFAGGDAGDTVMSCIKAEFEGKNVYISERIYESSEVIMDKVEPYLIEGLDAVGREHGELPDFIIADITELSGANGRYLYDSNTVVLAPRLFGAFL